MQKFLGQLSTTNDEYCELFQDDLSFLCACRVLVCETIPIRYMKGYGHGKRLICRMFLYPWMFLHRSKAILSPA